VLALPGQVVEELLLLLLLLLLHTSRLQEHICPRTAGNGEEGQREEDLRGNMSNLLAFRRVLPDAM
jgi:steroid 5-alpha reductase family enzyme